MKIRMFATLKANTFARGNIIFFIFYKHFHSWQRKKILVPIFWGQCQEETTKQIKTWILTGVLTIGKKIRHGHLLRKRSQLIDCKLIAAKAQAIIKNKDHLPLKTTQSREEGATGRICNDAWLHAQQTNSRKSKSKRAPLHHFFMTRHTIQKKLHSHLSHHHHHQKLFTNKCNFFLLLILCVCINPIPFLVAIDNIKKKKTILHFLVLFPFNFFYLNDLKERINAHKMHHV